MSWSVVRFGRHKGKTLPEIVLTDPDWFFWAVEDGVFQSRGPLAPEAADLARKARAIRIPDANGERRVAEYIFNPSTRRFSHMDIVPADQREDGGLSDAFRLPVIDLSVPRKFKRYDKLGCRNVLSSANHALFGSASVRMTRQRYEEFFDNADNFCPQGG